MPTFLRKLCWSHMADMAFSTCRGRWFRIHGVFAPSYPRHPRIPSIAQQTPSNKQANRAISYRRTCLHLYDSTMHLLRKARGPTQFGWPSRTMKFCPPGLPAGSLVLCGFRFPSLGRTAKHSEFGLVARPDPQAKLPEMLQHEAKPNSSIPESLP